MLNRSNDALVEENRYDGRGHRIAWRYDADASGTVVTSGSGADPWYFFVYDDKWRSVATIREGDSNPKERFVYHAAGTDGRGTSSYIDDVILRDADRTNAWTAAAASTLGNRVYYLQNQHHDVSVLMRPDGTIVERVKYSAYGVPIGMVAADLNYDGSVDDGDFSIFAASYNDTEIPPASAQCDFDVNGFVDDADFVIFAAAYAVIEGAGPGKLSRQSSTLALNTDNRIGYAGYSWSPVTRKNYVRFRVYEPGLGAWLTRDPLGYIAAINLFEYVDGEPLKYVDPIGLAPIYGNIPDSGVERLNRLMQQINDLMNNYLRQLDDLANSLSPCAQNDPGLKSAIDGLRGRFEQIARYSDLNDNAIGSQIIIVQGQINSLPLILRLFFTDTEKVYGTTDGPTLQSGTQQPSILTLQTWDNPNAGGPPADWASRPDVDVMDTLIHEMTHAYELANNLIDYDTENVPWWNPHYLGPHLSRGRPLGGLMGLGNLVKQANCRCGQQQ